MPSLEEVFRTHDGDVHVDAAVEPVVEITHLIHGVVHDPFVLRASNESYLTSDTCLSVHVGLGGGAITLDEGVEGTIRRRGRADAEERVLGPTSVVLAPTDAARFERGDTVYFVRAYRPLPPRKITLPRKEKVRIAVSLLVAVVVAFGVHAVYGQIIIQADEAAKAKMAVEEPEQERFADVTKLREKVKELEKTRPIEVRPKPKPKPRPKPVKVEPEKVVPAEPEPEIEVSPQVPKAAASKVAEKVAAARAGKTKAQALADTLAGVADPSGKKADTVGKLGGINVTADGPASGTAVAAMGTPGGGQYGAVGVEGSGGGGVNTKGGKAVAGKVAKLKARQKGRVVRGKVRASKSRARIGGEGELDKAKVYAVIKRATGRIRACYERALLKKPTLGGQIKFSWTITTSGSASGVRVRSSSIADAGVGKCIMGVLRKLRYPKPKGGAVTISFPFMFKAAAQ